MAGGANADHSTNCCKVFSSAGPISPWTNGATLACLLSGAAYAVDEAVEPAEGEEQCTQQLAAAEEAGQNKIDAKTRSEADTEKVNELIDQADAQCTEGNLAEATATLATVNKLGGK